MRTRLTSLLMALVLAGCAQRSAPEPIWIGHLAPLTGPDQAQGEEARLGIQLAVDEIVKDDKKIAGRSLAVVHVDSRNDDESVRAGVTRLVTINKVTAIIGSLDAALAERLIREAQSLNVTVVVSGEIAGTGSRDGAFALGGPGSRRGQLLARQLADWKLDKVAVVTDSQSAIGGDLARAFLREARGQKGNVLREWTIDSATDKGEWQAEVAAWKPSAVLLAAAPRVFRREGRRMLAGMVKVPLLYGGEDQGPEVVQLDGVDTPVYSASVICQEGLSTKGKEMSENYKKANGQLPGYPALQAFDAIRLIYEGLKLGEKNTGTRLRERLAKLESFESVTGPLSFPNGHTRRPVFLLQLKGRETKLIKTISADTE
jgi:branched-chain amino acid transport system substrate-binding protein